ncbi:MAG: hypothetical protein GEU81_07675 [Nitriliruptorales bacterium]|nr:hypothetical protein [Nitriliruptorales bacterium]
MHARTSLQVQLTIHDGMVHIAVADENEDLPRVGHDVGEEDEGGRGLLLVELLSNRWGCERLPPGKRMWFELDAKRT